MNIQLFYVAWINFLGFLPGTLQGIPLDEKPGRIAPELTLRSWIQNGEMSVGSSPGAVLAFLFGSVGFFSEPRTAKKISRLAADPALRGVRLFCMVEGAELPKETLEKISRVAVALDDDGKTLREYELPGAPAAAIVDPFRRISWSGSLKGWEKGNPFDGKLHESALKGHYLSDLRLRLDEAKRAAERGSPGDALKLLDSTSYRIWQLEQLVSEIKAFQKKIEEEATQALIDATKTIDSGKIFSGVKKLREMEASYRGSGTAVQAAVLIQKFEKTPRFAREEEAQKFLAKAEDCISHKESSRARELLKKILTDFGDTEAAEEAKALESRLPPAKKR